MSLNVELSAANKWVLQNRNGTLLLVSLGDALHCQAYMAMRKPVPGPGLMESSCAYTCLYSGSLSAPASD